MTPGSAPCTSGAHSCVAPRGTRCATLTGWCRLTRCARERFSARAAQSALRPTSAKHGEQHKGADSGEITYCPLNYTAKAPEAADVLDAERVDQLLAVVNHRFAIVQEIPGETRTAISELAQEADMLGCP